MIHQKPLILFLLATIVCSCGNGGIEKDLFLFGISEINDVKAEPLTMASSVAIDPPLSIAILDTMVFSYNPMGEANYYVFPLDNSVVAPRVVCIKGRREDEPMNIFPFKDVFYKDGEWKTYLFNLDRSRVLEWNLSRTLSEGKDVFENVSFLKPDYNGEIMPFGYFHVGEEQILVIDDHLVEIEKGGVIQSVRRAPTLDRYDFKSGNLINSIKLFKDSDIEGELWQYNEVLTPNVCVNPAGTKAFVAMAYLPDYFVIDIESGEAKGFRIKELPSFNESEKRWYFKSAVASEDQIYALYSGAVFKDPFTPPEGNDILYVFDWSGSVVHKYLLSGQYQDMWCDPSNGKTYLVNRGTGELAIL